MCRAFTRKGPGSMAAVLACLLPVLACDGAPTEVPRATSLIVEAPDSLVLDVGQEVRIPAYVRDQNARTIPGATVVFTSIRPWIARVSAEGMVRGVSPGLADLVVGYAGLRVTRPVRIRGQVDPGIAALDLERDEIVLVHNASGPARVALRATDAAGRSLCGWITPELSYDHGVASVEARDTAPGGCELVIGARGIGTTWVAVRSGRAADSLWVRVRSTAYRWLLPPAGVVTAGTGAWQGSVSVTDLTGAAVANVPVALRVASDSASVWRESAWNATTAASGTARLWDPPSRLAQGGASHRLRFTVAFPDGAVAEAEREIEVVPGRPAAAHVEVAHAPASVADSASVYVFAMDAWQNRTVEQPPFQVAAARPGEIRVDSATVCGRFAGAWAPGGTGGAGYPSCYTRLSITSRTSQTVSVSVSGEAAELRF